jgi:hypothetical protein
MYLTCLVHITPSLLLYQTKHKALFAYRIYIPHMNRTFIISRPLCNPLIIELFTIIKLIRGRLFSNRISTVGFFKIVLLSKINCYNGIFELLKFFFSYFLLVKMTFFTPCSVL